MVGRNILIIDNDKSFVKGLKYSLEQDKYVIESEYYGKDIIEKINKKDYDLILLDLILPDINGMKLCQSIRKHCQIPIIIITEKDEDINKIVALEYGADDYLVKPFNTLELKARIKAIFRRIDYRNTELKNEIVKIEDFEINILGRKINIKGREISLTVKEFDLFYVLISNSGRVFKREELLKLVWGYAYYGDLRTIDVHIRRIREKIENDLNNIQYILTKWGEGYYFKENNNIK